MWWFGNILALIVILLWVTIAFGYFVIHTLSYEVPSVKVILRTISRDIGAGLRFLSLNKFVYTCLLKNLTVGKIFSSLAEKHPDKICFIFEGKEWTFQQVEDYGNKVANAFLKAGYKKGDEVAIFMNNCPEYAAIWLGLSKVGIISALINTNLKMHSLAHCINAVSVKCIIFNDELEEAVLDVVPLLNNKNCELYCLRRTKTTKVTDSPSVKSLDNFIKDESKLLKHDPDIGFKDKLFFIYTSGTTGLPKAAILRHSRMLLAGASVKFVMKVRDKDIAYNTLPMYHSAGGMQYLSISVVFGQTSILRKKFSASNFWMEAIKYRATVAIYIGEICRFLLSQPPSPLDKLHGIRMICGNGLRPQIWREVQERFGISQICEFYGSTEGTSNLLNYTGKPGAVGFISRTFSKVYPVNLIQVDPETGEPIRDKNGLCVRCKPGEPGVIVAKRRGNSPIFNFDGYVNSKETEKKMADNCFQKGDRVFLSGDLMVMDEDGYVFFVDRTGDTFRWRGENVSTSEVEMVISKTIKLSTCVVYGVQIPGTEGRAGMAVIQSESELDMESFYNGLKSLLPSYAQPIFIRLCNQVELTGTYKLRKVDLQKEGFDVTKIQDPLYFLDSSKQQYVKLDAEIYENIMNGKLRL